MGGRRTSLSPTSGKSVGKTKPISNEGSSIQFVVLAAKALRIRHDKGCERIVVVIDDSYGEGIYSYTKSRAQVFAFCLGTGLHYIWPPVPGRDTNLAISGRHPAVSLKAHSCRKGRGEPKEDPPFPSFSRHGVPFHQQFSCLKTTAVSGLARVLFGTMRPTSWMTGTLGWKCGAAPNSDFCLGTAM